MVYIGVITHLLIINPNFQRDIQPAEEKSLFSTSETYQVRRVATWNVRSFKNIQGVQGVAFFLKI